MIAFLDKLENMINKLVEMVLVPCFFLLAAVGFMQVVSRYVLKISLPWSEELCRYLFIYATYLGSIIGVTQNKHIDISAVDLLLDKMDPRKRVFADNVIGIVTSVLSAAVLGWITYLAVPYLMDVSRFGQRTPAMRISMCVPVFSVPLGMGLMCVLYVKRFVKGIWLLVKGGAVVD